MAEILIRGAEPTDAEALQEMFSGPKAVAGTLQVPWVALEQRRGWLVPDPSRHGIVAVIDGRVVGNASLHLEPSPRRRDCGWIGMAVRDEFQGQGVGTAMMRALMELADGWYCLRRLELTVWADNAAAVHLYEKFGFVIEGTAKQYGRRAGELVDAYYMARLRPSSAST
jgi:putative acetyltransferase